MRSLLSLTAVLVAAVAVACSGSDPASPLSNEVVQADAGTLPSSSAIAGRDCPSMSPLTYQSFGGPFFSNYCTGCHSSKLSAENRHGAPAGLDFDTIGGIRANIAHQR